MTSTSTIDKEPEGYMVNVDCGAITYIYGPFQWHWVARLVAWFYDGDH